jgi:hypothetical protein
MSISWRVGASVRTRPASQPAGECGSGCRTGGPPRRRGRRCWRMQRARVRPVGGPRRVREGARLAAWLLLSIIALLSIVPPVARPVTALPHVIEHAAIFFVFGMLFGAGYLGRELILSIYALALCATLKLSNFSYLVVVPVYPILLWIRAQLLLVSS